MMTMFDEELLGVPDYEEEDVDMYEALGLTSPTEANPTASIAQPLFHDDPLAAFMDDDDEEEIETFGMFQTSDQTIEELLAVLVKDNLGQSISNYFPGLSTNVNLNSARVERDRDAYHLSLIVDMGGGHHIKPFATVLAVEDTWKPLDAPKGLSKHWQPLYEALCKALTQALKQQGAPSSI